MGEILQSHEPGAADPEPELEQLADWLIRYELSVSETKPELPDSRQQRLPELDITPEAYFERRHEVKDQARETESARSKLEMTPIAKVLSAYPPQIVNSTTAVPTAQKRSNRQSGTSNRLGTKPPHILAIKVGFVGGIVIAVASVVYTIMTAG